MNILLCSPDKEIQMRQFHALQMKLKVTYQLCSTAQECRNVIKSGFHPNFAIIDYVCPPGNGIDVIMHIRQKEELDATRILLMIDEHDYVKAQAMVTMLKAEIQEKPLGLFDMIRFMRGS